MIDPQDIFDLFEEDDFISPQEDEADAHWTSFDKGRVLGSLILRKVADLVDTYKQMDTLKDPENRSKAKSRTLSIYNKILFSYIKKVSINDPHTMRGIAMEEAVPVANIIQTLIKYFERKEDFHSCAYLQSFKEELLFQDMTRDLWEAEYYPL